jgi:hypothetical protein
MWKMSIVVGVLMSAATAYAQEEIVVTGSRLRAEQSAAATANIGIRRRADFAVQRVSVYGDAREKDARRREILQTVRNAIELGARRQILIAYGQTTIEPLTLANYADKLKFAVDEDRADAERVTFTIKTPLTDGSTAAAFERLAAFAKAVPTVGRAVVEADDEPGVSIVDPGRYRREIIAAIAADATAAAGAFGPGYAAEVADLARPVRWALVSPTEVLLYIDHGLKVVPKARDGAGTP